MNLREDHAVSADPLAVLREEIWQVAERAGSLREAAGYCAAAALLVTWTGLVFAMQYEPMVGWVTAACGPPLGAIGEALRRRASAAERNIEARLGKMPREARVRLLRSLQQEGGEPARVTGRMIRGHVELRPDRSRGVVPCAPPKGHGTEVSAANQKASLPRGL